MSRPEDLSTLPGVSWWKVVLVTVVAVALTALLVDHAEGWNGGRFWVWRWRSLPPLDVYPVILVATLPLFYAHWLFDRWHRRVGICVALVAVTALGINLGTQWLEEEHLRWNTVDMVLSEDITSYFADAQRLINTEDLLATYPERMPDLHQHSQTHPPGPVLYYMSFLKVIQHERQAALAGAIGIALMSALSIPATYFMTMALGARRRAALMAASCVALAPSVSLMLPELDIAYPLLSALVVGFWALALRTGKLIHAAAAGFCLALGAFFAYNLLALGIVLTMITGFDWVCGARSSFKSVLTQLSFAALTFCTGYGLLWLTTGFDPIQSLRVAMEMQAWAREVLMRPWPATILWDLEDFARGAGWIMIVLATFFIPGSVARYHQLGRRQRRTFWMSVFAVGQILIVAAIGLLPAETARLWAFMMPLLAVPAGLELEKWRPLQRVIAVAAMCLVLAASQQNLAYPLGSLPKKKRGKRAVKVSLSLPSPPGVFDPHGISPEPGYSALR